MIFTVAEKPGGSFDFLLLFNNGNSKERAGFEPALAIVKLWSAFYEYFANLLP